MSSFLNNPHSAYHEVEPREDRGADSEGGGGGGSLGRVPFIEAIERRFGSQVTLEFKFVLELRLRFELSGELVDFSFTAKIPESTSNESVT